MRNALESEIAELSSKIDELEQAIREIRSETARVNDSGFAGYIAVLLVAVIGSFLLGAFALFVLLRHSTKNPKPAGTEVRLQEMIDSLKQLIETRKQTEETEIKNEAGQVTRKEESTTVEPKVGDVWYAYCPTCGLRTEHGRDYEGAFCARCNTRST
jgi:DNA repair exonuclease SbcCD ATPase subunit